jgi:galactokinase
MAEQDGLVGRARAEFLVRFGRLPTAAAVAPGRVNLIGEHTDYNDGLVLPCAIDRATAVVAGPRDDDRVRVFSQEQGAEASFASACWRGGGWLDYVRAPASALREAGHRCAARISRSRATCRSAGSRRPPRSASP